MCVCACMREREREREKGEKVRCRKGPPFLAPAVYRRQLEKCLQTFEASDLYFEVLQFAARKQNGRYFAENTQGGVEREVRTHLGQSSQSQR